MTNSKDEVSDDVVCNMRFREKDIDRSHMFGKPSPEKKRPIIVKFVQYNDSHKAYSNKKRLKYYKRDR